MSRRADRRLAESMLEGAGDGPFLCLCCGKRCALKVTDEGIGDYEYWGAKGTDVQLVLSSDCCEDGYKINEPEDDTTITPDTDSAGSVGTNLLD